MLASAAHLHQSGLFQHYAFALHLCVNTRYWLLADKVTRRRQDILLCLETSIQRDGVFPENLSTFHSWCESHALNTTCWQKVFIMSAHHRQPHHPHQYGWAAVARVSDIEAGFGRDMQGFSQLRLQNVGQRARDALPVPLWRALRNSNTEGLVSRLCWWVSGVFICWCTKKILCPSGWILHQFQFLWT